MERMRSVPPDLAALEKAVHRYIDTMEVAEKTVIGAQPPVMKDLSAALDATEVAYQSLLRAAGRG